MRHLFYLCLGLLLLSSSSVYAQVEESPRIDELTQLRKNQLIQQAKQIDELARHYLGDSVRNNRADLNLLQRIADRKLIKPNDRNTLQALGAVLGNVMVKELGLEWKLYTDKRGTSRATCAPNTDACLFPITMLSRRLEVGLEVNVKEIYDYSAELMAPHLPKNSWGD